MTEMGRTDVVFTNSTQIANGATEAAGHAQETATEAATTAGQAQATAQTASQAAGQAAATAASAQQTANTAIQTANGKNTNYYGPDEPVNPKGGDAWFVENADGDIIAIRHWDGTNWVTDVDNTTLTQQISDAQTTAEKAAAVGQAAQQTANQAAATADAAAQTAENAQKTANGAADAASIAAQAAATAQTMATNAQKTADGKNMTYYDLTAPANPKTGDLWFKSMTGGVTPYRYDGTKWVSTTDVVATNAAVAASEAAQAAATAQNTATTALSTANGKNTAYYGSTTPANPKMGDIWFKSVTGGVSPMQYNGSMWVSITDIAATNAATAAANAASAASAAQTAANSAASAASVAQTTANGKGKVWYQTTAPAGNINDLWIDITNGANMPKRWNGSAWVSVTDKVASDAASAAATAQTTASNAASSASTAQMTANNAANAASAAQTAADNAASAAAAAQTIANSAASAASAAQTTANGRNKIFRQSTQPTASTAGDIWFDTANGNRVSVWNGYSWVLSQFGNAAVANLDAGAITTGTLAAARIAAASIDASKIVAGSLTSSSGVFGDINASSITSGTLAAARIAAGSIDASKIVAGSLTSASGVFGDINASSITSGTLSADRIAAGSITTKKLAAGAVTANELDANAVTAAKIVAGAIGTDHLSANAVTAAKIAANTITAAQIAAKTITAEQIAAGTITATQIAAGTIDATRIKAGTITSASGVIGQLDAGAITTGTLSADRIGANSITGAKLAANTITASQIASKTITANEIATGTLTSASGVIGALDAGAITTGTLSASRIASGSITADKLLIGDFTNLVDNPNFDNGFTGWSHNGGMIDSTVSHSGGNSVKFTTGAQEINSLNIISCQPGDKFYYSVWYKTSSDYAGPGGLRMRSTDASGDLVSTTFSVHTDWTQATYEFTVPTGVYHIQIRIAFALTAGSVWVDDVEFRRMATGNLIVDGAITASKIAAGSITATNGIIASIDASKIITGTLDANLVTVKNINASNIATGTLNANVVTVSNINASNITTGTLSAARIAAGSIDASKLSVSSLSAISANLGTVTTGTLNGVQINGSNFYQSANKVQTWIDGNGFHQQYNGGQLDTWINSDGINVFSWGNLKFRIDNNGNITANNATLNNGIFSGTLSGATGTFKGQMTAGSINIGSNFSVDSNGNLVANNAKLNGNMDLNGTFNIPTTLTGDDGGAGLHGRYQYTESLSSYNPKVLDGEWFLNSSSLGFRTKATVQTTNTTYFSTSYYGATMMKLRAYVNSSNGQYDGTYTNLNNRVDIMPSQITMGQYQPSGSPYWPDEIKINANGTIYASKSIQSGNVYFNGANSIKNDSTILYLEGNGGIQSNNILINGAHAIKSLDGGEIYLNNSGTGYVDLTVKTLHQASRWELKENFETMDPEIALKNIINTDVVRYNFKGESEIHVGLVIDDRDIPEYRACSDFITPDRQAKKDETIVGELMLATKALNAYTNDHKERLSILEEQNKNLILKVANLELELANIKQKLGVA